MNDKKYIVYIHENNINHKKYIGLTSQKTWQRWRTNGKGYKQQPKFYNAILKYGWENFSHNIVAENLSQEEASKLEKQLIEKYNTRENGYNEELGGCSQQHSPETVEKIRQAMIGKTHTQETKDKISNTKTDGSNSVICLETGIEYPSPTKASQETGIDKSSISRCCRGISLTAGGYRWRYTNPEKYEQFKDIVDNRVDRSKRKVQCIETGEIFDTATAAANFANADVTNIVKACRGKICTSKGYHWKYVS